MSRQRERICGIYSITNVTTNKVYIGQSVDILYRFIQHKCELHKNRHHNEYLQNAYNKYGITDFKFDIVEKCNVEELNKKEVYWIGCLKSNIKEHGYNLESGGNANKVFSEETRKK